MKPDKQEAPLAAYRDALQSLQDAEKACTQSEKNLVAAQKAHEEATAAVAAAKKIAEAAHDVLCAAIAKGSA